MQFRAGLLYRLRDAEAKEAEKAREDGDRDPLAVLRDEHRERLDKAQKMLLGDR